MATTIAPTTQVFERLVRQWVALGSGMASKLVGPDEAKGGRPEGILYATVSMSGMARDGFSWTRRAALTDANAGTELSDEVESATAFFSAQWYRDGAMDAARLFRLWASSPLGRMEAEKRGITLISLGEIRDLASLISEEWEERAQIDVQIGLISTARITTDVVGSLSVELDFDADPVIEATIDLTE